MVRACSGKFDVKLSRSVYATGCLSALVPCCPKCKASTGLPSLLMELLSSPDVSRFCQFLHTLNSSAIILYVIFTPPGPSSYAALSNLLSLPSRGTMSVNDRRASSYISAPRPRVASHRTSDPERAAALRNGTSPLQSEYNHINMEQMRGSTASQKSKMPREQVTSEKRTERAAINTREKAQTRSRHSVKETNSTGNRGDLERSRSKRTSQAEGTSPNIRKKEKETTAEGQCNHLGFSFTLD